MLSLSCFFSSLFSLNLTFAQDPQNFRFRIGRLILDLSDNGSANVSLDEYGLGVVDFSGYTLGSSGPTSFSHPFGQGRGVFSLYAEVNGWELSEGFASLDDATMKTTFRFVFDIPENMPPEVSLPDSVGFVLFIEGGANAWAHGPLPSDYPGYASASGNFNTEPVSASASISAFFPNPPYFPFDVYDYDPDPQQGYKRGATINSVSIASGQGDYAVTFSGSASTTNFNAMGVGSAGARTGVVVLSDVDPLGVPEVGDNEFVYEDDPPRLVIPASATAIAGFTLGDDTMQWLAENVDWKLSRSLPSTYHRRELPNYISGNAILPRFWDGIVPFYGYLIFHTDWLPHLQAFGKNHVILTFRGSDVHAANVEIFFPALGYNHPPGPPQGIGYTEDRREVVISPPNWMYYYYHAHPEENVWYIEDLLSFYDPDRDLIFIGDGVILGITGPGRPIQLEEDAGTDINRWFTLRAFKPYSPTCRVEASFVYGIDAYVRAVAHERKHRLIYLDYHELIDQAEQNGESLEEPYDDPDNDGLPNALERAEGLLPDDSDTIRLIPLLENLLQREIPIEYHAADQEVLADRVAWGAFGSKDLDWSDLGLNKWRGRAVPREVIRVLREGS